MPTRSHRLPGALAAVTVVGQLLALYWPVVSVQGPVSWTDKVVHGLIFLVPTYAVGRALQLAGRSAVAAVAVFLVHAPISEVVQAVVLPGRSGDPWDVVVDVVGVAVAGSALARRRRASDGPQLGARWSDASPGAGRLAGIRLRVASGPGRMVSLAPGLRGPGRRGDPRADVATASRRAGPHPRRGAGPTPDGTEAVAPVHTGANDAPEARRDGRAQLTARDEVCSS